MSLIGMEESEFIDILNRFLHPSSPIRQEELLRGRDGHLDQVRQALTSPGRSVFIYGLRGVGKTSLAQTAAYTHQSADAQPVLAACDGGIDFFRLIQSISGKLIQQPPDTVRKSRSKTLRASMKWVTVEVASAVEKGRVPIPTSVDEAVGLVAYCGTLHSKTPVVVVDEFDRLAQRTDKNLFGDFIKQLGDQGVGVKFILSGVGDSLSDLLAGHESCFRYLAGIGLDRLPFDPRMEIIAAAASELGVVVSRDYQVRIAMISDGFPHYIHLVGAKLFWDLFEGQNSTSVHSENFVHAIKSAIRDVEAQLQRSYEKATQKYGNEYQHVLWALADHPDLRRRSTDVYESYGRIAQRLALTPLDRSKFNARMNVLKTPSHGAILRGTRQGWYEFREPILRGYCRLRAEDVGVRLDREHPLESRWG